MESTYKSVRKTPNQCLKAVESYIFVFEKQYLNNKELKYDHVIPMIFRDDLTFNTQTELNSYMKCQLKVAFKWFRYLINEIRKEQKRITSKRLLNYGDYIVNFLHDISVFIEYFENKSNEFFKFLNGGKSYGQHTVFIYKNAINSYWGSLSQGNKLDHKGNISASSYFLRQSLELKFRRILGVTQILDSKGNSPKIRHEYFPEFIKKNISHFDLSGSSIPNLLKIYKWTNYTIHTSASSFIWEQWYAFEYCNNFIFPKSVDDGKRWSIHNSVKITQFDELVLKFYDDFGSNHNGNGMWCYIMDKPEAEFENA